jgi:hypothetical protein
VKKQPQDGVTETPGARVQAPKKEWDRLDALEDFVLVVDDIDDVGTLARCCERGLPVEWSGSRHFDRGIKGKRVIVAVPAYDPGRRDALETAERCRAVAASVDSWTVVGWGSPETPTLSDVDREYGLEKMLRFDEPWIKRADASDTEPSDEKAHGDPSDRVGEVEEIAFHGVLGRIARLVEPYTEANPFFLMMHLLAMFSAIIGRGPHFFQSGSQLFLHLFIVLVGPSGLGRKGTAESNATDIFKEVAEDFVEQDITSGLNSGAGLLTELSDEKDPDRGTKRKLIIEPELAGPVASAQREHDPMISHLRAIHDGRKVIRSMVSKPITVTEPHVSILMHSNPEEVKESVTTILKRGGFANRFMWHFGTRLKRVDADENCGLVLAVGTSLRPHLEELRNAIEFAKRVGVIDMTPEALEEWKKIRRKLDVPPPGLIGTFYQRAGTNIRKCAGLFAILDCRDRIECQHLHASIAIWRHSEKTIRHLFRGDIDAEAEKVLAAVEARPNGMTVSEIQDEVYGKRPAPRLHDLLEELLTNKMLEKRDRVSASGRGRKATVYSKYTW